MSNIFIIFPIHLFTLELIPDEVKDRWIELSRKVYECPVHKTAFNRTEEPCWQCYNFYE